MKANFSGILFSGFIGILSFIIAPYIAFINSIVLALFVGILVTNIIRIPDYLNSGINFSSKNVLEYAIILLGFGVSFQDIGNVGWSTLIIIILTITTVLTITFIYSKNKENHRDCGYLIGFGTAICGSSAIAALAPKINANKEEIGISIAVINLFGLLGMVAIPLLLNPSINIEWIGLFIGGTLHGVSNVAGAGYAMGETIGDLALTIKLGRVALLAPGLIFFNFLVNKSASIKENLKLPYYIIGFIGATTIVSLFNLPTEIIDVFRLGGKVLLTISMAAIGLSIKFTTLLNQGKVAIRFGAIIFAIQIIIVGLLGFLL
ncbi:MAG: YeiH family protein [Salibacteraceae bacterium]